MRFEDKDVREIGDLFISVINKYNLLEKTPRRYGTEELLYASELTTVETIGYSPGINITELAQRHGITKGAVSQVIKKLNKKGLVSRYRDPGNNRDVLLKLSVKGEIVFHQHQLAHLHFAEGLSDEIEQWTPEEFAFLRRAFKAINQMMDNALEYLNNEDGQ